MANTISFHRIAAALALAAAVGLSACNQSKADKAADDVAAMRALMEKQEAEKKAAAEKAEAENRKRFAELKAQAASDAKAMGLNSH